MSISLAKNKWVKVAFAALALLGILWWCTAGTWRYKITVNVDTPEGLKSGYAVREASAVASGPSLFQEGTTTVSLKGEAVVVDLGARGVLFAPMHTDDYMTVFQMFPVPGEPPGNGNTTGKGIRYYRSLVTPPKELPLKEYPELVMFRSLKDPKSITLVQEMARREDPDVHWAEQAYYIKADHFEELFGKGVKLHSITIEMTNERLTKKIEKWLPWMTGYPEDPILPKIDANDFSIEAQLRKANFVRR